MVGCDYKDDLHSRRLQTYAAMSGARPSGMFCDVR